MRGAGSGARTRPRPRPGSGRPAGDPRLGHPIGASDLALRAALDDDSGDHQAGLRHRPTMINQAIACLETRHADVLKQDTATPTVKMRTSPRVERARCHGGGSDPTGRWRSCRRRGSSTRRCVSGPSGWCARPVEQEPGLSVNEACKRIGPQLGIVPDTLRGWCKQADVDDGLRPGTTTGGARGAQAAATGERRAAAGERDLEDRVGVFRAAELDRHTR